MTSTSLRILAAALAAATALTACGTRGGGDQAAGGGGDEDLVTGPGVTEDTIALGVLSDLSVVYGPLGTTLVHGNQIYVDEVNDDGGICGRQLELVVRDHGHNVQTAVTQFGEVEPNVLGFVHLLGSPMVSALEQRIESAEAVTFLTTWSTDFLGSEHMVMTGTSYPVDIVNGLDYLVQEGMVAEGDTVGHVHFQGDFGSNALTGAQYAAEELGLTVEPVQIDPTATDLTAQVTALQSRGVSAILVSAGPRQTASIAGVSRSIGLDVPILSNGPGFDPALLETPAGPALQDNLYVTTSYQPFASGEETAQRIADTYAEKYPDNTPTIFVNYGYAAARVMGQALEQACENGDLSRAGVTETIRSMADADTGGLMPPLDLTDASQPSSTESFISRVDPDVPGGLRVVDGPLEADITAGFSE
jgi:ABC-type branched-subunit amino acid transport system substrate-binding protein